jgi:hypothetical protein
MSIKYFLVYILIIISIKSATAQNYTLLGDKCFGTFNSDLQMIVRVKDNSHLIIGGTTVANVNGDKTDPKCDSLSFSDRDIWLLEIDTAFNILWNKSIGGSRAEVDPYFQINTTNNNILLTCTSSSDSSCEKTGNNKGFSFPVYADNYWVCQLDTSGNRVSDQTWGTFSTFGCLQPQIIQLQSGNFIIAGISSSPIGGDKTVSNYGLQDYWVIKTDSVGNKLWDNVYGGSDIEVGNVSNYYDKGFMVLADKNDDFILAGSSKSPVSGDISDSCRGNYDIWLIKIDSAGHKIWDKRYGGSNIDYCHHIINTNDNGYIICGQVSSPQGGDVSDSTKGGVDCWVVKLDSLGNKQWDKRYGGIGGASATWIEQAPGGGYWVSGYTQSTVSFDVTEPPYGYQDFWILKIDSAGNKLFDKRFGGAGGSLGCGFVIMPDSSIFLYGESSGVSAVKTDPGHGSFADLWMVHFKYTDSLSTVSVNETAINNSFSIYPNPAKDLITVKSANEKIKTIYIYNLLGETILTQKINFNNSAQIDLQPFAKGFYLVKIEGEKNTITKRVVKN